MLILNHPFLKDTIELKYGRLHTKVRQVIKCVRFPKETGKGTYPIMLHVLLHNTLFTREHLLGNPLYRISRDYKLLLLLRPQNFYRRFCSRFSGDSIQFVASWIFDNPRYFLYTEPNKKELLIKINVWILHIVVYKILLYCFRYYFLFVSTDEKINSTLI